MTLIFTSYQKIVNLLKTSKMIRYQAKNPEKIEYFEDKWIVSRINSLIKKSEESMKKMELNDSPKMISKFILEDFSRWYVKLIRARLFGKDKESAKKSLDIMKYTLERLVNIFSPVVPFITEKIYRNITKKDSVHLEEWPVPEKIDRNTIFCTMGAFTTSDHIKAKIYVSPYYRPQNENGKISPKDAKTYHLIADLSISPAKLLSGDDIGPGKSGVLELELDKPLAHDSSGLRGILAEFGPFENKLRIVGYVEQIQ